MKYPGEIPHRQWVLTVPYTLRFLMAYDSRLIAEIHKIFIQAVFASLRRRAGLSSLGECSPCCHDARAYADEYWKTTEK